MSDNRAAVTIIAPRELRDLVYRCCRVQSVDPGTADRFAENVLHAQIHRGAVLETFLSVLGSSVRMSDSEVDELARLANAADNVELAEATARTVGVATVTFDFAVPLTALSHSLWQAANRGMASVGISPTALGTREIKSIELVTEELDQATQASAHRRHLTAHQLGLPVATSSLAQLESCAARFLVAEVALDTITP